MSFLWTPEAESYLLDTVENDNPFSVTLTVEAEPTEATEGGDGTPAPEPNPIPEQIAEVDHQLPDIVNVEVDGLTVTFSGDTTLGLFDLGVHVLSTQYEDSSETIDSWSQLTDDMNDIYQMDVPSNPVKTYTINVTATGSGITDTITVYIRVTTNYNINANVLKSEVNKRRFSPL